MLPNSLRISLFVPLFVTAALAAGPRPEDTWPGFRGHDMSGVAPGVKVPERWSTHEHVTWRLTSPAADGRRQSSGATRCFVTSAISSRPFKQPTPGLYGNDYIAELRRRGCPREEVMRRVRARDNESTEEAVEIRYMVYALDARHREDQVGARGAQGAAVRRTPSQEHLRLGNAVHRRRAAVRIVRAERRAVLLFARRQAAVEEAVAAAADLSRLRHRLVSVVHDGRVYLLHDSEAESYITALDAKTGDGAVAHGAAAHRLPEVVLDDAVRVEEREAHRDRDDRPRVGDLLRPRRHGAVADRRHVDADGVAAVAPNGLLYVGTGSQGDANRPFLAVKPGASGDISLKEGATSNEFIEWSHPRASGYTPSALVHGGRAYLVHDTGILSVLERQTARRSTRSASAAADTRSRRRPWRSGTASCC